MTNEVNDRPRDVLITVNSPGEVATWLSPVMSALQRIRPPGLRIMVLITPCVYASGTEEKIIRRIEGVDDVFLPRESLMTALFGRRPRRWIPAQKGVVLHLGGDLALSSRIGRRHRYPTFVYTDGYIRHPQVFERIMAPYEKTVSRLVAAGCDPEKTVAVGNLMVDAAFGVGERPHRRDALARLGVAEADKVVALFPGSRRHELSYAGPFFLRAAHDMENVRGDLRFVLVVSPFTDEAWLRDVFSEVKEKPTDLVVWKDASNIVMAAAHTALAIPGSVNAELAAWGVPHVVALPLDRPEDIPLDGLLGYVDRLPLFGKRLKRAVVKKAAAEMDFVSMPNRIARSMLLPELKSDRLTPTDVADAALRLLEKQPIDGALSRRLASVMGPGGAGKTLVSQLLQRL